MGKFSFGVVWENVSMCIWFYFVIKKGIDFLIFSFIDYCMDDNFD